MSCKRILCPSYLLESWQGCDFVEISTYFLCSNIPIVQAGGGECFPFFRIVVADELANVETIHKFIISALHVILLDAVQKLGLKDKQICVFVLFLGMIGFMLCTYPWIILIVGQVQMQPQGPSCVGQVAGVTL